MNKTNAGNDLPNSGVNTHSVRTNQVHQVHEVKTH